MPTEKAHGIQIMKMCEAFATAGTPIELVVPWRRNENKEDPFEYYRVKKTFSIKKLFSLDLIFLGKIGFLIQSFSFTFSVLILSLFSSSKEVVYYSREEISVLLLSLMGKRVIWETHRGETNRVIRKILSKKISVVAITNGLKDLYSKDAKGAILVASDAVDIQQFQINRDKNEIRSKLGFETEKKIVLYTGHLYEWKGAHVLAEAAKSLGENTEVVFVGGTDDDIETFKRKFSYIKNVRILGRKPHYEMPLYLRAADVLVIPNSAKEDISRLYTSPMKLFEYMASGTPIIASDLPSLREILNEGNACFFEADNAQSLAVAIKNLLANVDKQKTISAQMSRDIMSYSWDNRARNIIDFIKHV